MESKDLILSNKMADIYYFPANKMIIAIYHGLVDYTLFKDIISVVNTTAIEQGISGGLSDVTQLRGSYQRFLEYMEDTGFPLLIENGFRVQAQIISDDLIMINLSEKVEKIMISLGVNFKSFRERSEGKEWLKKELANK